MTIYLHRYSGVLPAGDVFNFGWHSSTGVSLATSHAAGVNWAGTLWSGVAGFASMLAPGVRLSRVTTYQLNPLLPFQTVAINATDVNVPGTAIDNSLPQDIAEVVSLRSDDPTRKGRGRIYLPAVTVGNATADGEFATASINNLVTALGAAWASSRLGGDNPVIFSRTTGAAIPITQFGLATVFDHQARRVNKVSTVRTFSAMP